MRRFDQAANDRIQSAVADIERRSSAEVVVKVVPASSEYPDVPWKLSAACVLAAVVALVALAPAATAAQVPPLLAGAGILGYLVGDRLRPVLRWILTGSRLLRTVSDAARLAFHDEALERTRDRSGVLVYVSLVEDRIVVVTDRALEGRAPGAAWHRLDTVGAPGTPLLERLDTLLAELGALVATVAPRRADDVNEFSDAPLIG